MIKKKYNPIIAMLISLMICIVVYFMAGIWPFGELTIVTGDLGGQYINFYSHFANAIKNNEWGGLIYGFDKSLGGTLVGNFAYYGTSIFNLLYLLVTPDKYPQMVTFILLLKLVLISGSMCFFLDNIYEEKGTLSIPLSLCYTYCAFTTVYYQNIMWFDALILLPVIAYGIHNMVRKGTSYHIYILCLSAAIISNFYSGYMLCLFCVLYFFYELILRTKKTVWWHTCIDFGVSSLCAGGLSAFLVVPMLSDVLGAKGVSGGITISGTTAFKFTEFFYRLFPFNFTWNDVHDGLPNVYTGMLCVLGIALFIAAKNIDIKEKNSFINSFVIVVFQHVQS